MIIAIVLVPALIVLGYFAGRHRTNQRWINAVVMAPKITAADGTVYVRL